MELMAGAVVSGTGVLTVKLPEAEPMLPAPVDG